MSIIKCDTNDCYDNAFKHICPFCKTEMDGENITMRSWEKGWCSHNGTDHYLCPNCKKRSDKRGIGPPYIKKKHRNNPEQP